MTNPIRIAATLALLLILSACPNPKHNRTTSPHRAYYYWQTNAGNFHWQDSTYKALRIDKLYVRFFDVDWNPEANAPAPVSTINLYYSDIPHDSTTIVPVVFITNNTFLNLDSTGVKQLAKNIHRKIIATVSSLWRFEAFDASELPDNYWRGGTDPYGQKSKHFNQLQKKDSAYAARWAAIPEIQFDCDWTPRTRDRYFTFLKECRTLYTGKKLSSTIRLYPYAYPKEMGIPPVNRGMLMCYNAGDIKDPDTRNAIFDRKEIMAYLEKAEPYALPLDYALPTFEWAVVYRDGKLTNILPAATLHNDYYQNYLTQPVDNRATVTRDFVLGYTSNSPYLRQGDVIRFESPDITEVRKVAEWLSKHNDNQEAVLSFYHLNKHDLHKYAPALEAMYSDF